MWIHRIVSALLLLACEGCALLWARRTLALSVFLFLVTAGLFALTLTPRRYEASLKILLTGEEAEAARQAESELLQSRTLLERTCQELGWTAEATDEAAAQLVVTAQARQLQLTYRDQTPERAAQFLQTLFAKYAAYRTELQLPAQPAQIEAALRERAATFNQRLDQATDKLQQFDREHSLLALGEQQTLLFKQLADTQAQADAARLEKQELSQQLVTLRTQLAAQPEQIEINSTTKYAQALDKLKEERTGLEMQRTQLRQKYQPNHRLLRDLEQRLTQVQELIAREEQHPPREQTFALNETRQRITNDLFAAETKLAALAPREQHLTQLVREYQTRLTELTTQSVQKNDLERERALHEEAYLLYQKKAQEAGLNAVLQQTKGVQIALAEPARANPQPSSPNWPRSVAGLLFLGLVISASSVLAVEGVRPRVRSAARLQQQFGLPVLAKLPASSPSSTSSFGN